MVSRVVIGMIIVETFNHNLSLLGYFIMATGGENANVLNDVELVSLDPILHPIPDCLAQLNPLPEFTFMAAGSLDYTSNVVSLCSYQCLF